MNMVFNKLYMEALITGTDAELMLRVKEGDESSFVGLLLRYRKPLVNYLYRMVQNAGVAEELAQDVFLRVYRARHTYEPTAKFTTWLYRIATHVALNHLRDGRIARKSDSLDEPENATARILSNGELSAEERLVANDREREIRDAIRALPEKQKAAVLLHKYQELDYKQIADALDCTESAVKSLLFRAYETLRVRLAHLVGSRIAGEGRTK